MINFIWFFLIIIGLFYSFISGVNMSDVVLNSSNAAFDLIKSLLPLIVLWSGIMNIANDSGLLNKFSYFLQPFLKRQLWY